MCYRLRLYAAPTCTEKTQWPSIYLGCLCHNVWPLHLLVAMAAGLSQIWVCDAGSNCRE